MTDTAQVAAVNTALELLGQEPVTDLSDASLEASNAAVKVLRVIETARDTVLRRHGWVCALSYVTLAPAVIVEPPNWRYPTAFLLPGDGLRVWEIEGQVFDPCLPGGWGVRWQVNTVETADTARTVIRAAGELTGLNVAYVRRANWAALDPHVRDAVAHEAAARAGYTVTGDRNVAGGIAKQAEARFQIAVSVDGTQEGGQPPAAPSIPAWLRAMSR